MIPLVYNLVFGFLLVSGSYINFFYSRKSISNVSTDNFGLEFLNLAGLLFGFEKGDYLEGESKF